MMVLDLTVKIGKHGGTVVMRVSRAVPSHDLSTTLNQDAPNIQHVHQCQAVLHVVI